MSELSDMGCEEFAEVAAELALGVLTGRERADALAHLDGCDTCRENVRRLTLTGEELAGLVPDAEPPPGFETRVMERLGLVAPAPQPAAPEPTARKRGFRFTRRMLTAAAVTVTVAAAGLGGWGLRAATATPTASGPPLSSAALLTASHQPVGKIFVYGGDPRWLYMAVDVAARYGAVTCQLVGKDGRITTVGSFPLVDGYGYWGSPDPVDNGSLAGARIVSTGGTVLATAAFPGSRLCSGLMELNGTTAIVSGGASGLGEATARSLAGAGALVVVADLNADQGKSVADQIGGLFTRVDVSDEAQVRDAVEAASAAGPPLRVAVNCAGIGWAERTVARDGSPHALANFAKVIGVNLTGTFNLMRLAAAAIARTDPADADGQRGVIVNTASVAGIEGQTGQVAYSASKGGIIGMTVPAARDLSVVGIRVNTIAPGIIDTPIYGGIADSAKGGGAEEFKAKLAAPVVFPKRMGRADEFAHLVRSLIENDYMNAEVIRFDGGIRFQPK
jgi:NAD(P)-dependent dehydrogenase (short-subunit alcohol dehydrogenase family)